MSEKVFKLSKTINGFIVLAFLARMFGEVHSWFFYLRTVKNLLM